MLVNHWRGGGGGGITVPACRERFGMKKPGAGTP